MTSPAVHHSDRVVGSMSRIPAAAEALPTQDGNVMANDSESIDNQPSDVAGDHTGNGAADSSYAVAALSKCEAPNDISNSAPTKPEGVTLNQSDTHVNNHAKGRNPNLDVSKSITTSNGKPDFEPPCTTVVSTQPVGIYYPPRRPNIFRARAKHLRFPDCDRNPIASDAVDKSEGAMEDDGEDFSLGDLEELQSDSKQKMEKKTERFVRMVQQTVWRSRVEDLGSVQEIEE